MSQKLKPMAGYVDCPKCGGIARFRGVFHLYDGEMYRITTCTRCDYKDKRKLTQSEVDNLRKTGFKLV